MKGQAGVSGIPGKRGYKVHLNVCYGYGLAQVLVLTPSSSAVFFDVMLNIEGEFYSPFCNFKPECIIYVLFL